MKKLYFIATLIFTLSICLGYYVDAPIVKTVGQVHELQNQITISVFWDILVNNTVVMITAFMGLFSFGLLAFATLVYNGFMFGQLLKSFIASQASISVLLAGTLPHALIEWAAFIIAGAWGLQGIFLLNYIDNRSMAHQFFPKLISDFSISVGLVCIAAIIEYFVSFKLLGLW